MIHGVERELSVPDIAKRLSRQDSVLYEFISHNRLHTNGQQSYTEMAKYDEVDN